MALYSLTIGPVQALLANVVYALPARVCLGYTDNTNLEVSNQADSGFVALTVTTNNFITSAAFIRCTSGTALVTLKAAPAGLSISGGGGSGNVTAAGTLTNNALVTGQDTTAVATTLTAAGILTFLGTPSSANLLAAITDETGTGALVFNVAPALTGPVVLTEAVGSSGLTITGATQTASFPALNITQTWNNAAVTFTGLKFTVTNTASAAASALLNLAVEGTSAFLVRRDLYTGVHSSGIYCAQGGPAVTSDIRAQLAANGLGFGSACVLSWSPSSGGSSLGDLFNVSDLKLVRDAAGILAQRNGTNAQTFRLYNTYTDVSNYEMGGLSWTSNELLIGVLAPAGTGSSRNLQLHTRGGNIGLYHVGSEYWRFNLGVSSRNLQPSVDNSYDIGSTTLQVRAFYATSIVANTSGGLIIGTATTQKLGFYNATPIVQGASVADATGGAVIDAEARTAINALISRIEATGLIATV